MVNLQDKKDYLINDKIQLPQNEIEKPQFFTKKNNMINSLLKSHTYVSILSD